MPAAPSRRSSPGELLDTSKARPMGEGVERHDVALLMSLVLKI
jgi:hypothetical protein